MKNKIQWIDSLKFVAIIAVFWGHFYMTFYKTCNLELLGSQSKYVIYACDHIIRIIVDGNFWVFVFCLLAGYFAVNKKITSIKELILAIIRRYIRFFIPILCTNFFVLGLQQFVGFHTQEWKMFFGSTWVGEAYLEHLTFFDSFKSAALLTHQFSGPFWVIRPIFFGTCLLYIYTYLRTKLENNKARIVPVVMVVIFFWLSLMTYPLIDNFYHVAYVVGGGWLYTTYGNI